MVIEMSRFGGKALVTRISGMAAYKSIMSESASLSEPVVFDFEGVDMITNSFADEVFGRIAFEIGIDRMRNVTSFKNATHFESLVIRGAIDARNEQRQAAAI